MAQATGYKKHPGFHSIIPLRCPDGIGFDQQAMRTKTERSDNEAMFCSIAVLARSAGTTPIDLD